MHYQALPFQSWFMRCCFMLVTLWLLCSEGREGVPQRRNIWAANVEVVRKGVAEVVPSGVRFTGDAHVTPVDTIVWATGYMKTFPFISQVEK